MVRRQASYTVCKYLVQDTGKFYWLSFIFCFCGVCSFNMTLCSLCLCMKPFCAMKLQFLSPEKRLIWVFFSVKEDWKMMIIYQLFWSHVKALCEDQTEIRSSLKSHSDSKVAPNLMFRQFFAQKWLAQIYCMVLKGLYFSVQGIEAVLVCLFVWNLTAGLCTIQNPFRMFFFPLNSHQFLNLNWIGTEVPKKK